MVPKNPPRGRPPSTDPHSYRVPVRFTREERLELERRARLRGLSLSEYLRRLAAADDVLRPEALMVSTYRVPVEDQADPRGLLVSSVQVHPSECGQYDCVTVFTRGKCAGTLIVAAGDGVMYARWLMPEAKEVTR